MKKDRRRITSAPASVNNLYFSTLSKQTHPGFRTIPGMEPLNSLVKETAQL